MRNIDNDLNESVLVLVFDNLDRLPRHKVQELWATIHTFFADDKYKNIKVIVPFDRTHIVTAFKDEDSVNYPANDNTNSNGELDICYGDDYINKTFDIIYRVSPPTMSNWKDYFTLKWSDAFGKDIVPSSYTLQIFDSFTPHITPRKIIAFINEFVAIKQMSYSSDIDDRYIALFVFGKSKISKDPDSEIIEPSFIGMSIKYIFKNDDDLPRYMSALYYQLEPNIAQDIILVQNLRRSLDNNDTEYIDKIRELKSFKHLLEKAIPEVSNISNAVLALEKNVHCERANWDYLYNMLINNKNNETTHNRLQNYQKILLMNITKQDRYLKAIINDFYSSDNSVEDAMAFSDDIIKLASLTGNNKPYSMLRSVNIEPAHFINFVKKAKGDWGKYKVGCDNEQFIQHLSMLDLNGLEYFDIAEYIKDDYDLTSGYKNNIITLINTNTKVPKALSILYLRLREIEMPVTKILSDADMHTLKPSVKEDNPFFYDLMCMRISRLSKMNTTNTAHFEADLKRTDTALVEGLAKRIEFYITYGDLLVNTTSFNKPLYIAVVRYITEQQKGASLVISTVLPKYNVIKSDLNIDATTLINNLNRWSKDVVTSFNVSNIATIPLELFKDIVEANIDNELSNHCVKIATNYLSNISKDIWRDSCKI
ncbi:MAG: P-loop NTPase fold protein [Rikenellaceae bacterium]